LIVAVSFDCHLLLEREYVDHKVDQPRFPGLNGNSRLSDRAETFVPDGDLIRTLHKLAREVLAIHIAIRLLPRPRRVVLNAYLRAWYGSSGAVAHYTGNESAVLSSQRFHDR
jgi:hypothetical protein